MRTNLFCCGLAFLISTTALAQTTNFDETWREFLENDKISNMSTLVKPDPVYKLPEYAKYLLMNTNTDFCQSRIPRAETLMSEVQAIDPAVHKSIPGFVAKMEGLDAKIDAYHQMDAIWQRFLRTKTVTLEELNAIEAAQKSCEKQTLAKYSFMTAHFHLCEGNVAQARNIFENRTLRLTEKTSLRVADVPGLAEEVGRMKTLFQDMTELDAAWQAYLQTGVSPGYARDLPLFPCYPIPNMKVLILRGATDICELAPSQLQDIEKLANETGVQPSGELAQKIQDLEAAVAANDADLAALNEAWEAFIPDNKVKHMGRYGYEYCKPEDLIRAYVMDGFAYLCELAEPMLDKIDSIQRAEMLPLSDITMIKINELAALSEEYQANGREIERLWRNFISQNDRLLDDYQSADFYCDNIHQVKDWTMQGLTSSCEDGLAYLQQIEDFQRTFEFSFTADVECRVQNLRVKVWTCRRDALLKLAKIEAPEAYDKRLEELMAEYGVGEQPEACAGDL
jgi:hypothetical protein